MTEQSPQPQAQPTISLAQARAVLAQFAASLDGDGLLPQAALVEGINTALSQARQSEQQIGAVVGAVADQIVAPQASATPAQLVTAGQEAVAQVGAVASQIKGLL